MWHDYGREKPVKTGQYMIAMCDPDIAFFGTRDYFKKGDFITYIIPKKASLMERVFGASKQYADRDGFYDFLGDDFGAEWNEVLNETECGAIFWSELPAPPLGLKWATYDGKEE